MNLFEENLLNYSAVVNINLLLLIKLKKNHVIYAYKKIICFYNMPINLIITVII